LWPDHLRHLEIDGSTGRSIHLIGTCEESFGNCHADAFAVLKLTTSSNLVGYWTGGSPGFAPRAVRSM
jgi:hypothetical protein